MGNNKAKKRQQDRLDSSTPAPKKIRKTKAKTKVALTPVLEPQLQITRESPSLSSDTELPIRSGAGLILSDPLYRRARSSNFYQSGNGNNNVPPAQQSLTRIFDQYRDNPRTEPDKIGLEGVQRYLTDLGVELDEILHLALCELLQCPTIGEIDREGFLTGWRSLTPAYSSSPGQSYDSITRQSAHLSSLRRKLIADPSYFKQVYRNTFKLAKPENQKSVPVETAMELWPMFFRKGKGGIEWNSSKTKWLDLWLAFYQSKVGRPVNKDLWNMVGDLVNKTKETGGESIDWWTEDGAWPMAIDEFVTFVKTKRGPDSETMDTT